MNKATMVVANGGAGFPFIQGLDYLLLLDGAAAQASNDLLGRGSLVLVGSELAGTPLRGDFGLLALPFVGTARDIGNKRVANIVALAALVAKPAMPGARPWPRSTARFSWPAWRWAPRPQGLCELESMGAKQGLEVAFDPCAQMADHLGGGDVAHARAGFEVVSFA